MSDISPRIYLAPASSWNLEPSHASTPSNKPMRHASDCPVCSSGPWMYGRSDAATVPCPHAHLVTPIIDEELRGKTILLIQPYCIRRRRLLYNLKSLGVRILGYQSNSKSPGMSSFISDQDWLIGPPDDLDHALDAVNEWLEGDEQGGKKRTIDAIWSYDEYGESAASVSAPSPSPSQSPSSLIPHW